MRNTEYTIPGTKTSPTKKQALLLDDGVTVTDYHKHSTEAVMQVEAPQGGTVTLPLFGYDGYRAELNGEEIAWTLGENNRLKVEIPAGTQGELHVWFADKLLWRAAEMVSLLAVLGMMAVCARRKKL